MTVYAAVNDINACILNTDKPAHFYLQMGTQSAIDLSICSPHILQEFIWDVLGDTHASDHHPIFLSDLHIIQTCRPPKYNFKKADWRIFYSLTLSNNDHAGRSHD